VKDFLDSIYIAAIKSSLNKPTPALLQQIA
jgi:hypothetical protein